MANKLNQREIIKIVRNQIHLKKNLNIKHIQLNQITLNVARKICLISDDLAKHDFQPLQRKKLKQLHGIISLALIKLSHERLIYTRRKPEPHVASYEHGETDKIWRIRYD